MAYLTLLFYFLWVSPYIQFPGEFGIPCGLQGLIRGNLGCLLEEGPWGDFSGLLKVSPLLWEILVFLCKKKHLGIYPDPSFPYTSRVLWKSFLFRTVGFSNPCVNRVSCTLGMWLELRFPEMSFIFFRSFSLSLLDLVSYFRVRGWCLLDSRSQIPLRGSSTGPESLRGIQILEFPFKIGSQFSFSFLTLSIESLFMHGNRQGKCLLLRKQ